MTEQEHQIEELRELQSKTDMSAFKMVLELARDVAVLYPANVVQLRLIVGGRALQH